MKIEKIKLSQIKQNPNNPRKMTSAKFDKLIVSILVLPKMLDIRPVVIDATYTALGGNMRTKALEAIAKMKPEEIAARLVGSAEYNRKTQGEKDALVKFWGKWLEEPTCTIIKASELTEEEKQQFIIKDNAAFGEWDWDALASQFDNAFLDACGVDVWQTEFPEVPTNEPGAEIPEACEDDFNEESDHIEVRCKRGDIWQLGEHRLMCGDSISLEDVKKLIGGGKIDMVFTDPPYGYNYQSNMREKSDKFDVIKNDDKILDFFPIVKNICSGFIFVCTTWKVLNKWIPLFERYLALTNMVIWNKGGGGIGDLKHTFATDYEVILVANQKHELTGKRCGSVWNFNKDSASTYVHPTQKPIALPAHAISETTNVGDCVLDVFGGSGSTLIACEQTKRKCFMMELDTHYCDVILARWEKLTGKTAKRIDTTA